MVARLSSQMPSAGHRSAEKKQELNGQFLRLFHQKKQDDSTRQEPLSPHVLTSLHVSLSVNYERFGLTVTEGVAMNRPTWTVSSRLCCPTLSLSFLCPRDYL